MIDCQDSLSFYLAVTADSWISWEYFPSLGFHRSAVKVDIVRQGLITIWGEVCVTPLKVCYYEIYEITLSEEYFHSSTLSMLFLLVNLGLAPTGQKQNKACITQQ